MKRIMFVFFVCQVLVAATPVLAAIYTDETAWRNAVGNVYALETFDSIAAGSDVFSLPSLGISFDPLNDGTQPTVQRYVNTGGVVRSGPNNLLNDRDFSLPARGPYGIRPISSSDLLFGIGLWNVGGDDTLRMTEYDAGNNVIQTVTSSTSFGFFGLVDPAGANRIVIDFVGGNGYAPVDDLQTAVRQTFTPTDVPEPTGLVIWTLLGALAIGGRLLRR